MQHKWRMTGLAIFVIAALIPALTFASSRESSSKPPTPPTVKPVVAPTTLRLALPDTSVSVDPGLVADDENAQLANLLYSGLVRLDASYHVVPDAASRYVVSADHLVYTFYLRHGLRFSNGDPVTAGDFAYAITRSLSPVLKSPSAATYLLDIKGARAVLTGKATAVSGLKVIDAYTLQITARWPVPYFLMELTYPTSFALDPKAINQYGAPDNTDWYTHPVGSGPYRLQSWDPNNRMVLKRNKYYYGTHPSVGTVDVSLAPLPGVGADLYRYVTQNLDVVTLPAYDSVLAHEPGIHETKMLSIAGIYMSVTTKPFDNIHVRRALTMSLDRATLVNQQAAGIVSPFGGFVPPGQAGYDPRLHLLPFNPAQARHELALGGFSNGKKFPSTTLYYGVDANNPDVATLIQHLAAAIAHNWEKNLKISVNTQQLTLNTLYAKAQANTLGVYLSGWSADYPDAHDWLSEQWKTHALDNIVGFSDKAFDDTVETADVTWNPARRMALYDQAQQILVNDAAWIPMYIPYRLVYIRSTVKNVYLTGYGIIPKSGSWATVRVGAVTTQRRVE